MISSRSLQVIARLVAMKREELDLLRSDLQRLQQMKRVEEKKLSEMRDEERDLEDDLRASLASAFCLCSGEMLDGRRYLGTVRDRVTEQEHKCRDVDRQCLLALREVESMYSEIRAMEHFSDRVEVKIAMESRRGEYLLADDEEIMRISNKGFRHVEH